MRTALRFGSRRMSGRLPRLPGVALDIDGVLRKGSLPLKNAAAAIRLLKTPVSALAHSQSQSVPTSKSGEPEMRLPVVLMTNGGGYLEDLKANETNRILGLSKRHEQLQAEDMILCHTPLRELAPLYRDKHVIVAGLGDVLSLAVDYGFKKALTLDEYSALLPQLSRLSIMGYWLLCIG
jgi:ribonucleotide monophosphatase NagD (HAD superfamily)